MKSKKNIEKILIIITLLFTFLLSIEKNFAQCGTYFETSYRKIVAPGFYATEDWNNDGKTDFWRYVANPNGTNDIHVYFNNGSGDWSWDNPTVYTTPIPSSQLGGTVIDLDTDGDKDIIMQWGNGPAFFKNLGNGTFTFVLTDPVPNVQVWIVYGYANLNGDNMLDQVTYNWEPGTGFTVKYRLANADGSFGPMINLIVFGNDNYGSEKGILGDFNGDSKTDLFLHDRYFLGNGNGTFGASTPVSIGTAFTVIGGKDFNNDGRTDILATRQFSNSAPVTTSQIKILFGQSDGTFIQTEIPMQDPNTRHGVEIGEFNGDNFPDLIQYYENPAFLGNHASYSIYINNGSGVFTRTDYTRTLPDEFDFTFVELNGDGKTDAIKRSTQATGHGNIFGDQRLDLQFNQCTPQGAVRYPDFNGDLEDDFVLWNPGSGTWRVRNASQVSWGAPGDIPVMGDYDADGKTDYSVYRPGEGNWYIRQSSDNAWLVVRFGLAGDVPVPNDYDGGGKTDIAVWRPSDGNWHFWFMETQQYLVVHWGLEGDKPVPADYDGDGKTDIAIWRPTEGNWYYYRSSDQGSGIFHWGIEGDKPVPADYDGDSKADLTVYRNGDWYILRSSNNSFNLIHWGTTGDIPMGLYHINEESASLGVYRPTMGVWYIYDRPDSVGSPIPFNAPGFVPIYFGLPNN